MEDSTIVEMYWNRDEDAIYWTNQKYGAMCQNIAYSILDSHEDAEECTNDTWMKAWNSIPPLRPKNLKAWLGRVARNLALDRWDRSRALKRGEGVEHTSSMEQMWEELGKCIPDSRTPEKEVEGQELGRFLEKWLKSLAKDDRQLYDSLTNIDDELIMEAGSRWNAVRAAPFIFAFFAGESACEVLKKEPCAGSPELPPSVVCA